MSVSEKRELFALGKLLDYTGAESGGTFHYTDYYARDNMKVVRGTKSRDDRVNFLMPDNPESSELDWWILYAVNTLKMADFSSIYRYLTAEKRLHPELLFTLNDTRIVRRRLSHLSKLGFLVKYVYVINTDINVDDAQEVYKLAESREQNRQYLEGTLSVSVSLDDEYMDELSEDEVGFVDYDNDEYNGRLKMNTAHYHAKRSNGLEVLNEEGKQYRKYFGKKSELVILYSLEEEAHRWLKDRFGVNIASYSGNPIVKLPGTRMSFGAVGFVASHLSQLSSYNCFKTGRIVSKRNGNFVVPAEMEFKVKQKDGTLFSYNCGIFKAYYLSGEGRVLPQHEKGNLFDTIYCIKNYIGIKGVTKEFYDGFVIVVVNDMVDMLEFMSALMKTKITEAESNRIFFTGEGIINSTFGLEKMIGFKFDDNSETGYSLYPVRLPVI